MKRLNPSTVESLINDRELAPLFIDYVAENLKMTLGSYYAIESTSDLKFRLNASKSLSILVEKLEGRIDPDYVQSAIGLACDYYVRSVFPFMNTRSTN